MDPHCVWSEANHVRTKARREASECGIEPKKTRRLGGCETQGLGERHIQQFHGVAYRRRHVERRSRKGAVGSGATAVVDSYFFPIEFETRLLPPDWRHRIGNEHWMRDATKREAKHGGCNVFAVHDHTEPRARSFKCCRYRARFAACERWHCVEKMSEAGEPLCQRCLGLRIRRHRMPKRYTNTGIHKPGYEPPRDLFRCQRNECNSCSR